MALTALICTRRGFALRHDVWGTVVLLCCLIGARGLALNGAVEKLKSKPGKLRMSRWRLGGARALSKSLLSFEGWNQNG